MPLITLDSISTGRRRPKKTTATARGWFARVALAACAAALPPVAQAQSISYRLDPNHTSIQWEVQHFKTSTLRGRFQGIQGQIRIDALAGTGEVSMVLNVASVNTGVPALDGILRGDQFFDVKRYPQAFFVARNLKFDAGNPAHVYGELTLRDASIPLTLRATNFNCYDAPSGQTVCGGDFEAEMFRSSAGMGYGLPFVGDRVRLRIQVEAFKE
jgi:polyisoprenoid-binding protein YceI